ncbi:MAG: DUF2321 domain-containing protein [bacterium]|jgi:hypothetical protein
MSASEFDEIKTWRGRIPEHFDRAIICENGHLITSVAQLRTHEAQERCSKCGLPTIQSCKSCGETINGSIVLDCPIPLVRLKTRPVIVPGFELPKFCSKCGSPYPWTENRLQLAEQMAAMVDELDPEGQRILAGDLKEIANETPAGELAAGRIWHTFKNLGKKIPSFIEKFITEVAAKALAEIALRG